MQFICANRTFLYLDISKKINHTKYFVLPTVYRPGGNTFMLARWMSSVGMLVCSCVHGFCSSALGPTLAESGCLITGTKLFNFAYGYMLVSMGFGWLVGAPAAGQCLVHF